MGSTTVSGGPDRNYYGETMAALGAQAQIAPVLYGLEAQYQPKYAALQANTIGRLSSSMANAANQTLSQNPQNAALVQELNRQAQSELALGGRLSPAQIQQMQQASRAAFASRGLNDSGAAVADEIIRQYDLGTQLQNQRRAFASGMVGLNNQTTGSPLQYLAMAQGGASALGPALFNPESQYNADIYASNQQKNLAASTATSANRTAMATAPFPSSL